MELQRPRLPIPLSFEQHPESRIWPTAPTSDFVSNINAPSDITLPDLKTVLSPEYDHGSSNASQTYPSISSPPSSRSLPPMDVGGPQQSHARYHTHQTSVDSSYTSQAESRSTTSMDDRAVRAPSVASVEDPRERIAAEVLSDFARGQTSHMPSHAPPASHDARASGVDPTPEPLLELIAQAHPWVGGTIKGSLSAYTTTKHYSPRFVQYGANLVERNITIPVVSAVSSVGEMTGAEHGLRRYLGARRPAEEAKPTTEDQSDVVMTDSEMQVDALESPNESLPAYRASRPPSYRELPSPVPSDLTSYGPGQKLQTTRPPTSRSWSSQFLITTSGLSVALSKTSRESLKACLHLLGQSFGQVQTLSGALSMVLQRYEEAREKARLHRESVALEQGDRPATPDQDLAARELANAIQQHCDAIWSTLRWVVEAVSNSVGGALPDNARHFVRQQFMSLPQRWQIASNRESAESETSRAAQRMIGFATEGLDMLTQVSSVLKVTLDSAEKWLERVGRSDPEEEDYAQRYPQFRHLQNAAYDGNVHMPTTQANAQAITWDTKYPVQAEITEKS